MKKIKIMWLSFSLMCLNAIASENSPKELKRTECSDEDPVTRRNRIIKQALQNPDWRVELPGVKKGLVINEEMVSGGSQKNSVKNKQSSSEEEFCCVIGVKW